MKQFMGDKGRSATSVIAVTSILTALTLLTGCGAPAGAANGPQPDPEVGVVEIAPQAYESTVRLAGRVTAFQVSEVRPQVGGIVRARRFEEGATVRAGQVLYEIDAGPAQADVSSAQAAAASSRSRLNRYRELAEIDAVSRQELDDARAASDQAAASLRNAQIGLAYTRVTAPISGIIGASSVTSGALATPSQAEPFAVIQQIDRVYVDMTQSSAEMMRLRRQLAASGAHGARVRLTLPDGSEYPHDGRLQFSDVSVDESTGTVRLRAIFPNDDHLLLPGMFVQAKLATGANPNTILAPQQGVTRNAKGEAVAMVLNPKNVVEQRVIETGATAGDKWVVLSGLSTGDRLIVDGLQRIRPGATAKPVAFEASRPQQDGALQPALRGRQNG